MTLTLKIENYDMLDDGGPAQFTVSGRGAQIGRSSPRDWVLPDPTKHISGHHFDILFQDGFYYLQDVSTNGTFLQGSRYRLEQPHRLNTGDRFQVGPYYIVAHVMDVAQPSLAPAPPPVQTEGAWGAPAPAPARGGADPWDMGGPAAPVDVQPTAPVGRREDFADDFIANPVSMPPVAPPPIEDDPFALPPAAGSMAPAASGIQMPSHLTTPPQAMPAAPISQPSLPPQAIPQPAPAPQPPMTQPVPQPLAPHPAPVMQPQQVQPQVAPQMAPAPDPSIYTNPTAPPAPNPMLPTGQPLAAAPRPDVASVARTEAMAPAIPAQHAAPAGGQADFVRAFCEAAGLAPDAYADVDPLELARSLGQSTRFVAGELMALLQVRDAAKQFTRGGERTMRRNSDNNPLKFLPDADQAIEAMYLKHRAGFLKGPEGIAEALRDVRIHQTAVFAAIQPALAQLLADMSPEEIEAAAGSGGGMLGGGKRTKAWETFVERWDGKAAPHDNGMLGEFLVHFANAYADVVGGDTN